MSLATSPCVFTRHSSNLPATPSVTPGTAFTAGANGADGDAVELLPALAHDVHFIRIRVAGIQGSSANSNAAGDLLIDPAGGTSWSDLISDLACGFTHTVAVFGGFDKIYEFPLWIPAGTSIGWQAKTAHTVDITTGLVMIEAFGEPSRPEMWWCGQGVETLGISDSSGTPITPVNGSWGAWTSVGSTTSRLYKAVQLGVNGTDGVAIAASHYLQVGCGSQPLPGSSTSWATISSSENAAFMTMGLTPCNIPVGTQMQARGFSSTTAENFNVAIYGVF